VRFNEEGLAAIDKTDPAEFPAFVATTFENRKKVLKPEQHKFVKSLQHWADILYKIKTKTSRVDKNDASYIEYIKAVSKVYNEYEKPQRLQLQQVESDEQPPSPEEDLEAYLEGDYPTGYSGRGFSGKAIVGDSGVRDSRVTCPDSIVSDISRLEVLIGGKRAGNNSIEIINEAADICRRLFQGGIMNIEMYRELIDELVEDYSD